MDECKEGAQAAADYLDTLVRIADKYHVKRERYVRESIMLMVCISAAVDYDNYKLEGE